MRILILFIFGASFFTSTAQSFFDKADVFFVTNVSDGMVDYKGIKANPADLDALVAEIAELDLTNKRVSPEFLKAFYINAYNILVIKQVVERYPIYGPLKVEGFFSGIKNTVMGKEMTLDELEKGTLYKQFPDGRLHFVLVCAAKGCPPISSSSYKPEGLDGQLTKRTQEVLNLDWFIRVKGKKTEVSQLFDWYAKDFGDTKTFINKYRSEKIPQSSRTGYYTYDWSLNDK